MHEVGRKEIVAGVWGKARGGYDLGMSGANEDTGVCRRGKDRV